MERLVPSRRGPLAADGFPIPPQELRALVSGIATYSADDFLEMGRHCAERIRTSLREHGRAVGSLEAILDFGCGCGRTMRSWTDLGAGTRLYGTDYNARLVGWCKANLGFARFARNRLAPPLAFAKGTFDLVYAFSVLTHLPEPLQSPWMAEFRRILKPGGFLALSTMSEQLLPADDASREAFRSGRLVVLNAADAGGNSCLVFHPATYMKEKLAPPFEVVEAVTGGAGQDFWLLRNAAG